jgi:CheY-like chemotaxis protein
LGDDAVKRELRKGDACLDFWCGNAASLFTATPSMKEEPLILIAEDEEIDVILLKRAFKAAGSDHTLKIVGDGIEAIEYLAALQKEKDSPLPVLFLLDINMPRCNGLEVLERMQGTPLHRLIPTVVFSSSNHPDDIARAYRLGAHAYLVKPTSTTQRQEMIKALHAFWLGLNRVPSPRG